MAVDRSKIGRRSRSKGKRAERQAAEAIREVLGLDCRRSQQFKGTSDSADVLVDGVSELFVEVKMVEKLNLSVAMATAIEQAADKLPVIMHRKSREPWLLTLRFADLPRLIHVVSQGADAG